jgi:predicted phage terminase large subunit-like protein
MSKVYTIQDLDLLEQLAILEAREDFYAFRKLIHPKMKTGWFTRSISHHLQDFYVEWMAGNRPKLAISTPPQHGKSSAVVDFIAWCAGKNPEKRVIFSSFSERLGVRSNMALQRIYGSKRYQDIFPNTKLGGICNRELLEYVGSEGYFRNTTVRGSITGESLDLGIIDDAIKGREAANSETIREAVWEWLTDDFFTRFSDEAGLLVVATRWHVDDPIARLEAELGSGLKVINYPALAEQDEKYRNEGEPLFPELKSIDFLNSVKKIMAPLSWLSLFQGTPKVQGGQLIHTEHFNYYNVLPLLEYRCIYADTAMKTKERNDFSVLQCWGKGKDGRIYMVDMIRGKWEAPELERKTIAFWNKHHAMTNQNTGQLRSLKVEDKASGTGLIQKIRTIIDPLIPVEAVQRNIDKLQRWNDVAGYQESGYVFLPENAIWLSDFLTECESFSSDDSHLHDDQIDPMMDAIVDMVSVQNEMGIWGALGKR